jgi:hypothetical protein
MVYAVGAEDEATGNRGAARLAGLAPEQVLSKFAPEQRLAGLAPEHVILALPVAALRALSDDYLASLPLNVREEIRKRIRQAGD